MSFHVLVCTLGLRAYYTYCRDIAVPINLLLKITIRNNRIDDFISILASAALIYTDISQCHQIEHEKNKLQ